MLTDTVPTDTVPTSYQDRIIEVVRHVGGDIDMCRDVISAIPAAEPTRLEAALGTVLPVQIVVTGTLDRRLLFAQHPERDQWTVADLAGQPHTPEPGHPGHAPPSRSPTRRAGSAPPTSARTASAG